MLFNLSDTGMSFYNQFLTKPDYMYKAKGMISTILMISPDEYMAECAKIHNVPTEREYMSIDKSTIAFLHGAALYGELLQLPVLDYAGKTQEGRHRAMLMKELGHTVMPVLIVARIGG